jgi:hypothetical protein
MIELTSASVDEKPETVELFRINGKSYTAPAKPGMGIALRQMKSIRDFKRGDQMAVAEAEVQLLIDLVGEEGYEALCGFKDLTPDQYQQVIRAAMRLVMGQTEDDPDEKPKEETEDENLPEGSSNSTGS